MLNGIDTERALQYKTTHPGLAKVVINRIIRRGARKSFVTVRPKLLEVQKPGHSFKLEASDPYLLLQLRSPRSLPNATNCIQEKRLFTSATEISRLGPRGFTEAGLKLRRRIPRGCPSSVAANLVHRTRNTSKRRRVIFRPV